MGLYIHAYMSRVAYRRSEFGQMGMDAKQKLRNDNDIKIIIIGRNSQTGIGKTTLAIQLCRFIDEHGWSAEEKSFVNTQRYIEAHLDKKQGSCLLFDEIEGAADNRRAMSNENVDLSQAWAKMRARNIATVTTLPTTSMLDKRLLEMADYQVIVKRRGVAQPYQIRVNDFQPSKLPQRKPLAGDEHIQFDDLASDDPDKKYLDERKDELQRSDESQWMRKKEHQKELEKQEKELRKELRNEYIKTVYENTDLSTVDLAEADWVDVSQSQVSRILNEAG